MGQTIDTNQPDKPISGATIMRRSLAGRKTKFVSDSTVGSLSITIAANSSHGVILTLDLWSEDLPTDARNANNIISWNNCVAWSYEDLYIDNDLDTNYLIYNGNSLSAGQRKVKVNKLEARVMEVYSGSVGSSHTTNYRVYNDDSSPHTIYFYAQSKYIIYGEDVL